jgi:large subunit ribosomal protein L6
MPQGKSWRRNTLHGELMSRIGKKPIDIPKDVKVEPKGLSITVAGPLGSLQMNCPPQIKIKVDAGKVLVENEQPEDRQSKQMHGTMRALIANMVVGVTKGFEKKMEIYGTGYNVKEQSGKLVLQVGFANIVEIPIPKGLKVKIEIPATKGNEVPAKFTITGADKAMLGKFAAETRMVKPPEPYKGKGIRYADEQVKRKVGKAFTSGTA